MLTYHSMFLTRSPRSVVNCCAHMPTCPLDSTAPPESFPVIAAPGILCTPLSPPPFMLDSAAPALHDGGGFGTTSLLFSLSEGASWSSLWNSHGTHSPSSTT